MSPIEAWYWPPDDVHGGENEEVNDSEDDEPDSLPEVRFDSILVTISFTQPDISLLAI